MKKQNRIRLHLCNAINLRAGRTVCVPVRTAADCAVALLAAFRSLRPVAPFQADR